MRTAKSIYNFIFNAFIEEAMLIKVAVKPTDTPKYSLSEWKSMCEGFELFDNEYKSGSQVTFFFADGRKINFQF